MIQEITRGNTEYIDAPTAELKKFIGDAIDAKWDELMKRLPKPETKVLPLPVWKTKQQIMLEMGIKSNTGFSTYRKREIRLGNMKMKKAGRNNLYLITEK